MRKLRPIPEPQPNRGGTTLTEVLIATLCMGIGVAAVATLFPIALLRSVQATQLTHSAILRFNAETTVDILDEYNSSNPLASVRNLVHNPNFGETSDNGVAEHIGTNYLVDPLGWNIVSADGGNPNAVGNMGRFRFGLMTEQAAETFVTLPDSWITLHEEIPVSNTATSVTLNTMPQEVLDSIQPTGNQTLRVVLFNQDENLSETRFLTDAGTQISGNTISWPNEPSLPGFGGYGQVVKVRIEVRERRYTWLLSVRNVTSDFNVPQALVEVVIFFRRSPSVEDETAYVINGTSRTYTVAGTPNLSKGIYMLDTDTGAWHRVQKIDDSGGNPRVTLEKNTAGGLDGHTVVFMRGVIDVYPLGTKP